MCGGQFREGLANLTIQDGMIMLSSENPAWNKSPDTLVILA